MHPLFEIVTTKTGAVSIRNKSNNETMHNPVGPWLEANLLYVEQSKLREHLSVQTTEELVVYDIGLGAAANAIAAIIAATKDYQRCARSEQSNFRPFRIISFEKDLELLRFALKNANCFAHFSGYETAIDQILNLGSWQNDKISWILRQGNFLDLIDAESYRPHLVFFDPYSPMVNREMWTIRCFEKIRKKSREPNQGGTSLFTYSLATRVRVALLRAGFFVGHGRPTGLKKETTVASTDQKQLGSPLGQRWLDRWRASHDRYPYDCKPGDELELDVYIENLFADLFTDTSKT